MRYCFSGHESFFCKAMWLKKGYDFINGDNHFSDADAVVKLGVGKNMVNSIRFWMKSLGLLADDELTDIAKYIFDDEVGKDPYLEDSKSLWVLHYLLVSNAQASIYNLFFLDFQREKKEFRKDSLVSFIKRKCSVPEQQNVYNENSVKKDIRVLFHNYIPPVAATSFEEYSGLLIDLGLVKDNLGSYSFRDTARADIDPLIILFALVHSANGDKTISFDKLQELSLTFCIPTFTFLQMLRELGDMFPNDLAYTDNSGIRNVQFLKEMEATDVLNKLYS